ncbi:LysM peptidoglycan-binding domain-containing protein [Indiicoccus explosivorum]|uniref:LysM peptidoglycan-binding domain-containing protein n=1 Tax=Indiicoccus explosivorum TaxID=1917864 RepID=UPI000B449423
MDELIENNDEFDPTALPVGAEVNVDIEDESYFIEPGDTLSEIAAEFDTTVDTLIEYNPGVEATELMPGDAITIGPAEDGVVDEVEEDDEAFEYDDEDDIDEFEEEDELLDEEEDEFLE